MELLYNTLYRFVKSTDCNCVHRPFIKEVCSVQLSINNVYFPGAYSWEFLVGVCRPVLQILTLFQTKKCNFPHPFSDQALRQKYCYELLRLELKQIKSISNSYFSFFLAHLALK